MPDLVSQAEDSSPQPVTGAVQICRAERHVQFQNPGETRGRDQNTFISPNRLLCSSPSPAQATLAGYIHSTCSVPCLPRWMAESEDRTSMFVWWTQRERSCLFSAAKQGFIVSALKLMEYLLRHEINTGELMKDIHKFQDNPSSKWIQCVYSKCLQVILAVYSFAYHSFIP